MGAILEIKDGQMRGKYVMAKTGETILVGRAQGRVNFAVPQDTFMSGIHFSLECSPQGCRVIDKSRNGTYLNGTKIADAMLANGDEIRGGQTVFKVRLVADDKLRASELQVSPASVQPEMGARGAESQRSSPEMWEAHPPRQMQEAPPKAPIVDQPSTFPTLERRPTGSTPPAPLISPAATSMSKQRTHPSTQRPRLTIGSWSFSIVPQGWDVKDEFGIQRIEKDAFPSSVIVAEEMLAAGVSLREFVESQLAMLRRYLQEPEIEPNLSPQIPGSDETAAINIRYKTKDGQTIIYRRVYVRSAQSVGTITLTTLASDLEQVQSAFASMISGVSFGKTKV